MVTITKVSNNACTVYHFMIGLSMNRGSHAQSLPSRHVLHLICFQLFAFLFIVFYFGRQNNILIYHLILILQLKKINVIVTNT